MHWISSSTQGWGLYQALVGVEHGLSKIYLYGTLPGVFQLFGGPECIGLPLDLDPDTINGS
jgi:hypothetical protein